jgi:DegV family protein with EDD domain
MDQPIKLVTDSSSDLPPELAQKLGIEVVPLWMHFGTSVYPDGALSADEFWEKAAQQRPTTSQPSIGAYTQVFEPLVAAGHQVLCVTLTSKHSGTYNSALLAAQQFPGAVRVFDSESLSWGLGLQAVIAAQDAQAGRSMREVLAHLEDVRKRMRLIIVLDTLENLRFGGRADGFMAVADRMTHALNIKVIINLVQGHLRLLGAARSFKRGLVRARQAIDETAPFQHLVVVHTRNLPAAEATADQLARQTGFARDDIGVHETKGVLAAHAGPGVIGILALPRSTSV